MPTQSAMIGTGLGTVYAAWKDTGYTKICPICAGRHALKVEIIGLARDLAMEECAECRNKEADRLKKYAAIVEEL